MNKNISELKPHKWNTTVYGTEQLGEDFISSIRNSGIKEAIVIKPDGTIISGHRRWYAAQELGIKEVPARIEEYATEIQEREAFIDYNRYREKNFTQKMSEAGFIEDTEKMKAKERQTDLAGTRPNTKPDLRGICPKGDKGRTRDKVATQAGLGSGRTYERAKPVWEAAKAGNEIAIKVVEKLDAGDITINQAYKTIKQEEKREEIKVIKTKPLDGLYDIIYADPPWKYDFAETENRAIENHYPTMELEDIKNIEVPSAENSALFLWATAPKLLEALDVMKAWGFIYKTQSVWDKEMMGSGYWFRGQHEILLVGVKGKYSPPPPENRESSVYREKRTKHSKKPNHYYEWIEKSFPNQRYLEMFSRKKHNDKWEVWGNQSE